MKLFRLDVPPERAHQLVAELEKLVAADLTHPAIAAPVAAGISGTSAYLALDFVAADSLDVMLRDHGRAPAADALRVASQLGGALDFAADRDVVHGSLHPRDVLLSPDDARMIGLGVTRAIERIGVTAAARRPYTAPERASGGSWDHRADIFSLAVLIYEMLSGKRVTAIGDQAAEVLAEVAGADAQALRRVFACALADEPGKRFDSALGFAAALKDALALSGAPSLSHAESVPVMPVLSTRTPPRRAPAPADVELPLSAPEVGPPVVAGPEVKNMPTLRESPQSPDLRLRTPDPRLEAPAVVPPPAHVRRETRARERVVSIPVAMRAEPDIPIVRAPAFGSEPDPVPAEFHEIALETSRNRVWPLFLAVGIGLVVGFAGGYGVATRDKLIQIGFGAADPPVQAAPAQTAPAVVAAAPVATPPGTTAPPTPTPVSEPAQAAPVAPATANLAVETGRIVVRSTPEGARVSIDGHDAGTTPATVRDIARGSHTVRVTRDGYVADERKVAITAARPSQTLTIDLARSTAVAETVASSAARSGVMPNGPGGLTVESRPEGASVFVDGKMVGTTPLTIDSVAAGEHSVGLAREGYSRWASSVRVTTGERARVTASLEK